MTQEKTEAQLREAAEAELSWLEKDTSCMSSWKAEDVRALIAFLDRKCELAFEAGRETVEDHSLSDSWGNPLERHKFETFADWNKQPEAAPDAP
jgi:hypothetical protein